MNNIICTIDRKAVKAGRPCIEAEGREVFYLTVQQSVQCSIMKGTAQTAQLLLNIEPAKFSVCTEYPLKKTGSSFTTV
jgi:hypothetical protein